MAIFQYLSLIVLLSLSSTLCEAVNREKCRTILSEMLGGKSKEGYEGHGNKPNFDHYHQSQNILFLSEGSSTLAFELSQAYPSKNVVSTDVRYTGTEVKNENWSTVGMDNRDPFPFKNNEFDTIIMRRGLCICNGSRCCAGFEVNINNSDTLDSNSFTNNRQAKNFFSEVVRVLDKTRPHSRAVLHGSYRVNEFVQQSWRSIFEELEAGYPIEVNFQESASHPGKLIIIEIVVKNKD